MLGVREKCWNGNLTRWQHILRENGRELNNSARSHNIVDHIAYLIKFQIGEFVKTLQKNEREMEWSRGGGGGGGVRLSRGTRVRIY